MSIRRKHPLNQSRLYRVTSPAKLAEILGTDLNKLRELTENTDNYIRFTAKSGRQVEWPKPVLRAFQKRIAVLLSRIETPDYLHSAVAGRSYVTNARQHRCDTSCVKVDIKKFFQSVRAEEVFHFSRDKMLCAGDVAGILAKLLTVDGHLPTGGSASPILSFFAYSEMFDEIDTLAHSRQCAMSSFIDDMSFTGIGATRELVYRTKKIVGQFHLRAHKTKLFRAGQARVITGVAVTQAGTKLPNRRRRAISRDFESLKVAGLDREKAEILLRLTNRLFEASQIDPIWRRRAELALAQLRSIKKRMSA